MNIINTLNILNTWRERRAKKEEKQRREQIRFDTSLELFRNTIERCNAANNYLNTLKLSTGTKAQYEKMRKVDLEYLELPRPMQQVSFAYEETLGRAWGLLPDVADLLRSKDVVAIVELQYMGGNMFMGRPVKPKTLDEKL